MGEKLSALEAVAEAWASMDGKLNYYQAGKKERDITAYGGYHAGYKADAEELIERIKKRGYVLKPLPVRGHDG